MRIGAHVSIAGGLWNAPDNAAAMGCEVFQMFSRSPRGGPAPKLTQSVVREFQSALKKHGYTDFVIHTPYYINFASTTPRIRYGSISVVREELERGTVLGADYVITHLGSTKDAGAKLGFHKTWRSIQRVLAGYRGMTGLLLELSAGAGDLIGGSFEELAALIKEVEGEPACRGKVNVCLDTCHAFAAGYDLRTRLAIDATLRTFVKALPLTRLRFLHGNDSMFGLGEHRDRHQHIGQGQIGREGFRAIVNHPRLNHLGLAVETPPEGIANDIKTLKGLRVR